MRWYLKGEPRPVQIEALKRSEGHDGFGVFLEQRLGKTAVALNTFVEFVVNHDGRWLLVLSPNSFKPDWIEAVGKWGVNMPAHLFESSDLKSYERFIKKHHSGIVVANYEALAYKDKVAALEKLVGRHTMIVADESIKLKNPASATFKAAHHLAKQCGVRRALSGKPSTQGPHDFYSQLRFIGELDGWTYSTFKAAFCEMGGFQARQIKGVKNADRLNKILNQCSWVARKVDWIEGFESPDYVARRVEMTGRQKELYDQLQDEFLAELDDVTITAEQIVTRMLKQTQVASGFIIDENGRPISVVKPEDNPRVNLVKTILTDELQTKLIVYCHYRHTIDMLLEALAPFNPAVIRGRATDVTEQKKKFNEDPTCRVIVGQIEATKYGHELIGSKDDPCLTSLYFENSYSLDSRSQTEERNRYGDVAVSTTIIDVYSTPLDEATIKALQRKESMVAAVMGYARETGVLPPT